MKKKIIVLGSTGMLGWMVYNYLSRQKGLDVIGTSRDKKLQDLVYFSVEDFLKRPTTYSSLKDADYMINCVGIIKPYCKDNDPVGVENATLVNALFPHRLKDFVKNSKVKIIQIATDCVYSGKGGDYLEDSPHDALDVYGKTKSLGEVFEGNFLNIRCSIIGPENKGKLSLLEWFLSQPEGNELNGFSHHKWNGVTTLQYARLMEAIIRDGAFESLISVSPIHHFIPNNTVTKFELLNLFKLIYKRQVSIKDVNNIGPVVDRTLASKFSGLKKIFPKSTLNKALVELSDYQLR